MAQIKICGITNLDDARVAADAGADLLGFIFYAKSPRYIAPERAREIVQRVRHASPAVRFVGVFVNDSLEQVRATMGTARLDFAQLHGDESAAMVRALSPRAYKALRPRDALYARAQIEMYRAAVNGNTPALLVDAFDARQFGGTGTRADWEIAEIIAREFPLLLAGGLNAENVADAIQRVRPWGVDVSSGVERAPGLKDHAKVREFIRAAKIDGGI
ncbi:MAG: phosphoribosylanthranilate isomerase [Chloroflexi bacterium]|nr:phosphoribosylanthranilate isomerase [Chloroflexota bacterium]